MSDLPMPPAFRDHLTIGGEANRSLVFDRGVDRWTHRSREKSEVDKPAFFAAFVKEYKGFPGYTAFRARRAAAFERLGAKRTTLHTAARLVVGLGLPHPTETGFLFDRLTGCPYLPGSTVKGLLRATATIAASARSPFWTAAEVDRIFGPVIGGEATPATGSVVFYDAFPTAWPVLEVDVLTPHYPSYYRSGEIPGDWDNPNPVPFLTIRAGEAFDFWFSPRNEERWAEDHRQLERLLVLALDWLGVGAKKASGYGYFEKRTP
jgi:CRISPR-associated protein Cmr6